MCVCFCLRPQRVSLIFMRSMLVTVLKHVTFHSTVVHDRSLPGKGLCVMEGGRALSPLTRRLLTLALLVRTPRCPACVCV